MKKLKKNHGFTLAELLVVIAILAILIAIAVPVFSGMVADANLRVNQANVRSVRSAAVAYILTNLDKDDSYGTEESKLSGGLDPDYCWAAIAAVNNSGDITDLRVYVVNKPGGAAWPSADQTYNGIYLKYPDYPIPPLEPGEVSGAFYAMSDDVTDEFATLKPSSGTDGEKIYWVQAMITDLDPAD